MALVAVESAFKFGKKSAMALPKDKPLYTQLPRLSLPDSVSTPIAEG